MPVRIEIDSYDHLTPTKPLANGTVEDDIWPEDVEQAFQEAYSLYPSTGRTKIRGGDGRLYGRNELISKYIYDHTGKIRTRKQVSSHIQVLVKKFTRDGTKTSEDVEDMDMDMVCLPTPRSSNASEHASALPDQPVPSAYVTAGKLSPRKQFDLFHGALPTALQSPTSPTPASAASSKRNQGTRRSSLDMMLSAAIYIDRSLAVQVRDESLPRLRLRLREFEAVFNWHQHVPSVFVSCTLESNDNLQVQAQTMFYSYGNCVQQTEHAKVQMYQDYEKWVFVLDQKPLSKLLGQIIDGLKGLPLEKATEAVEGVHIRLLVKSSHKELDTTETNDYYFTLQPVHDAKGHLSLVFQYVPF